MAVPILQTIVGVVLVLLGIDTAKTPPTTRSMLWLYRFMFLFLGGLFIALCWIQHRNVQRAEAEAAMQRPAEVVKPEASPTPLVAVAPAPAAAAPADPKQTDYQQKYQALIDELASNPALDPNLRERLIVARSGMAPGAESSSVGWSVTAPNTRPVPATAPAAAEPEPAPAPDPAPAVALSPVEIARERLLPHFDFAVKTLAALTEENGLLKSDKIINNYKGIPAAPATNLANGKHIRAGAGDIRLQKNLAWDFRLEFSEFANPQYEGALTISCVGGVLVVRGKSGMVGTRLDTTRGQTYESDPVGGSEARANISEAIGRLVAAELEATAKPLR